MPTIKSVNPATQELNGEVESTPIASISNIVSAAKDAQEMWSSCFSVNDRLRVLTGKVGLLERFIELLFHPSNSFKKLVYENRMQIAELITRETGKPMFEVLNSEVQTVLDHCDWLATNAEKILAAKPSKVNRLACPDMSAKKHRDPHGVVVVIAPFNYPFAIPVCTMLNALVAGNGVILKHSPKTALTAKRIGELFAQIGLASNLVQIVQGDREETVALLQTPPNKVVFTGSIGGGKAIMRLCAENVVPLSEELGGKAPAIVFDLKGDALRLAAKSIAWACFTNNGQACAAVQRIYVQRSIADEFVRNLVRYTKRLKVGNGLLPNTDTGPLIDQASLTRVKALVTESVAAGAVIATGGNELTELGGFFFEPTILVNARQDMRVVKEEVFGPVVPVIVVDSVEEAIELANDSTYFLGSSVWSSNRKLAMSIAKRVKAGMTWVNNSHVTFSFPDSHWGGRGLSGFGTTHGPEALLDMTTTHYVTDGKVSDRLWFFPYGQEKLDLMDGATKVVHAKGLIEKAGGAVQLLRALVAVLSKKDSR